MAKPRPAFTTRYRHSTTRPVFPQPAYPQVFRLIRLQVRLLDRLRRWAITTLPFLRRTYPAPPQAKILSSRLLLKNLSLITNLSDPRSVFFEIYGWTPVILLQSPLPTHPMPSVNGMTRVEIIIMQRNQHCKKTHFYSRWIKWKTFYYF